MRWLASSGSSDFLGKIMVLPDRIELSASPLPRECSTPELRQQGLSREALESAGKVPQGGAARKAEYDPIRSCFSNLFSVKLT